MAESDVGCCSPNTATDASVGVPVHAEAALPTFQRNVLRKYFRRANFTAEDVAAIDYHRLVRFPGVGAKGIQNIRDWLHTFGLELKNVPMPSSAESIKSGEASAKGQRIAHAIALLRKQGFIVRPRGATNDPR